MTDLKNLNCQALEGHSPMNDADIQHHLTMVQGWSYAHRAIEKTYSFKDYFETIAFVNALAWICNAQDHHPELTVTYNRCVVRFDTHSVGGISINDFICAAKLDALVARPA